MTLKIGSIILHQIPRDILPVAPLLNVLVAPNNKICVPSHKVPRNDFCTISQTSYISRSFRRPVRKNVNAGTIRQFRQIFYSTFERNASETPFGHWESLAMQGANYK